ncbi:SDR family NAD(P)-dependent oxidoreductase [Romboutsia sp.]|uniref:SDR family NAD(P)-dependent oxidoreductase n=1 Tax=Romboutsia sp. TaxID=1965302 RepID=UPI003F2F7DED
MSIKFDFSNKTVIVTGGTKGIGKCIAEHFAKANANVAIIGRDEVSGKNALEELQALGSDAQFYKLDVCDENAVEEVKDEILKKYGKVEILVNCAGVGPNELGPPFTNISANDIRRVFNINTVGMTNMCKSFYNNFYAQQSGKIINIASIAAYLQVPVMPQYCASKAATISFSNNLAMEMGSFNVNVNCVNPGFVYTNIYYDNGLRMKNALPQQFEDCNTSKEVVEKMASQSALGRMQDCDDMAFATLFLASEEARNITGQCINVDSGIIFK